jgi:hypothetical protein
LHVHLSHYAVNDATASLFLAATLFFGARALAGGHWRELLLSSAMAGLAYGAWIDGASAWLIAALVAGVLGILSMALWLANGRLAHETT